MKRIVLTTTQFNDLPESIIRSLMYYHIDNNIVIYMSTGDFRLDHIKEVQSHV